MLIAGGRARVRRRHLTSHLPRMARHCKHRQFTSPGQAWKCAEILPVFDPPRTDIVEVNGEFSSLKISPGSSRQVPHVLGLCEKAAGSGRHPAAPPSPGCVAQTSEDTRGPASCRLLGRQALPTSTVPPCTRRQAPSSPSSVGGLRHPSPQQVTWVWCFTLSS